MSLLVAPMVSGHRELIAGLVRDQQFGMTVMVGVGGILAEAVGDVVFCPVPLRRVDAEDMIDALAAQALLGPFRGEPAVDRDALGRRPRRAVGPGGGTAGRRGRRRQPAHRGRRRARRGRRAGGGRGVSGWPADHFQALFEPRGVVVAGASTHPGKFGFVSLHNLLAAGYHGRVFGTNLEGRRCSASRPCRPSTTLPEGQADLVFVCTPAAANVELLRACAAQGDQGRVRHLGRLRRGGRRGPAGTGRAGGAAPTSSGSCSPAPTARAWCRRRSHLCAQIVAPVPAGRPHRRGQPERQLRVVVHELRPGRRASASAGRCRPATRPPSPSPTTSTTTPTIRPPR